MSRIDDANKECILAFVDAIKNRKTNVSNHLRANALYYKSTSKLELSFLAGILRKKRISSTRRPFELKRFRDVNKKYILLLEKEGITNVDQMLEKGRTPHDRQELPKKDGDTIKVNS